MNSKLGARIDSANIDLVRELDSRLKMSLVRFLV